MKWLAFAVLLAACGDSSSDEQQPEVLPVVVYDSLQPDMGSQQPPSGTN